MATIPKKRKPSVRLPTNPTPQDYLKVAIREFGGKPGHWHQHPNGGGWVRNTAFVHAEAYVGEAAVVAGSAHVSKGSTVYHRARVYGQAMIGWYSAVMDDARVSAHASMHSMSWASGHSVVDGHADLSGGSRAFEHAHITGHSCLRDGARVSGRVVVKNTRLIGPFNITGRSTVTATPFFAIGSNGYFIQESKPGFLKIGCTEMTPKDWIAEGRDVAKANDWGEDLIAEFSLYVAAFQQLQLLRKANARKKPKKRTTTSSRRR